MIIKLLCHQSQVLAHEEIEELYTVTAENEGVPQDQAEAETGFGMAYCTESVLCTVFCVCILCTVIYVYPCISITAEADCCYPFHSQAKKCTFSQPSKEKMHK